MERVARIELALSAWKAGVIPLYDTRERKDFTLFACVVNRSTGMLTRDEFCALAGRTCN